MTSTANPAEETWSPARFVIAGIVAIVLLVCGIGGWSAFARLAGAVIVDGELRAASDRQVVQHRDGGIVDEIRVRDGDHVAAGDVLFRLDGTRERAELGIIDVQLDEALARIARLSAERDDLGSVALPPELQHRLRSDQAFARIVDGQKRLFEARRQSLASERAQLDSRIDQIGERIRGADDRIAANRRQAALIDEEIASQQQLFDRGLATAGPLLDLKREQAGLAGEIASLRSNIAEARSEIAAAEIERLQLDDERREQTIGELRDLQAEVAELRQQRVAIADRLRRIDIRAPLDGIVHDLAVHARQSVIQPAEPLLYIVPDDQPLIVEVAVEPTAIDNLYLAQETSLRFPAFNMRTTPSIPGLITGISADRHVDEHDGESYYKVEIALDERSLSSGPDLALLPGMPVEAHIRTDERTPLSYLLKPLADQLERAMREE